MYETVAQTSLGGFILVVSLVVSALLLIAYDWANQEEYLPIRYLIIGKITIIFVLVSYLIGQGFN